MYSIRVTAPDGGSHAVPFNGTVASVGRAADNTVVLSGEGVSAHHCQFEVIGATCTLKERGSTNGTWLNNRQLDEPSVVSESDRIYVGTYLLQLVSVAPLSTGPTPAIHAPVGVGGPIIRQPGADRSWRELHARLLRYAEAWEQAGRPDRLALTSSELKQAQRWLARERPDSNPPVTQDQRDFIAASAGAVRRRSLRLGLGLAGGFLVLGGSVATAVLLWPRGSDAESEAAAPEEPVEPEPKRERVVDDEPAPARDRDDREKIAEEIEHVVIPIETLTDIAARYGVTVNDIAQWNTINPDEQIAVGTKLSIKKPKKRPLPQQKITYEVEKGETSWTKLSERFGISVQRLQAYNPEFKSAPKVSQEIVVWVDPRPYKPREPRQAIPEFEADQSAIAIGHPNEGRLENGIEMPKRDELYMRRYPRLMYGSALTISNLQKAIAIFRQDLDFDGVIVIADISKKGGGHFDPHKSHQQGRDVDIWLPTLRGVFKPKYLTETGEAAWGRRPTASEVDWFAAWGLLKALHKTGAVQDVFLDRELHDAVYNAAVNMGASQEDLDALIEYPRKSAPNTLLKHSAFHYGHYHIRFKCAPHESACKKMPTHGVIE